MFLQLIYTFDRVHALSNGREGWTCVISDFLHNTPNVTIDTACGGGPTCLHESLQVQVIVANYNDFESFALRDSVLSLYKAFYKFALTTKMPVH